MSPLCPHPPLLVVEQDRELFDILCAPLRASGHPIEGAHTWADALSCLRAGPVPRAIVIDVSAPGFERSPLAAALATDTALREVPVIALSSAVELRRELPPSTVAVLIGRPVRGRLLAEVLDRVLAVGARRRTG